LLASRTFRSYSMPAALRRSLSVFLLLSMSLMAVFTRLTDWV